MPDAPYGLGLPGYGDTAQPSEPFDSPFYQLGIPGYGETPGTQASSADVAVREQGFSSGQPQQAEGFAIGEALRALGMVHTPSGLSVADPTLPVWAHDDPLMMQAYTASLSTEGAPPLDMDKVYAGRVFMGDMSTDFAPRAHIGIQGEHDEASAGMTGATSTPDSITYDAALNLPYSWSEKKTLAVEKQMREAGFDVSTTDQMIGVWKRLVGIASMKFAVSHGENKITPWDQLALFKKENIAAGKIDKDGNVTRTSTASAIFNVSDGDAWSAMIDTARQLLGRDPSDQEVRDLVSRANAVAAKDPTTRTTTTTTDAETGQSTSSSTTDQGFGSNDLAKMAYDDLWSNPETGAYQAVTTYLGQLLHEIGSVAPTYSGG